jgi:hypothetical protein
MPEIMQELPFVDFTDIGTTLRKTCFHVPMSSYSGLLSYSTVQLCK